LALWGDSLKRCSASPYVIDSLFITLVIFGLVCIRHCWSCNLYYCACSCECAGQLVYESWSGVLRSLDHCHQFCCPYYLALFCNVVVDSTCVLSLKCAFVNQSTVEVKCNLIRLQTWGGGFDSNCHIGKGSEAGPCPTLLCPAGWLTPKWLDFQKSKGRFWSLFLAWVPSGHKFGVVQIIKFSRWIFFVYLFYFFSTLH
jgi:hypothetical protein